MHQFHVCVRLFIFFSPVAIYVCCCCYCFQCIVVGIACIVRICVCICVFMLVLLLQVRRHCTVGSCWLVASNKVYDVSEFVYQHPAGAKAILQQAGGRRDCVEDIHFHSKAAQRLWKGYIIATLRPCPGPQGGGYDKGRNSCSHAHSDTCVIA